MSSPTNTLQPNNNGASLSMFGPQSQQQQQSPQPQQGGQQQDQSGGNANAAGMVQSVASVRHSIEQLVSQYKEFSQLGDEFNKKLIDMMQKQLMKEKSTEGSQVNY